ncbi:MAG: RND transporter [Deltaproteobacteria bacterium]|nr:MAG: RND transporter [Deltaproteobacteria bacterium]
MRGLAFAIACILVLSGCRDKVRPERVETERQVISGVEVKEVRPTKVEVYYETSGTVKARTITSVASRVMGTVTSVMVKEGDRVREGDLLLTIDDRDLLQRVEAARESYKEAIKALELAKQNKNLVDTTYRRYKRLYDERVITEQEMDEMETRKKIASIEYERAQAALKRAKASLLEAQVSHGFTRITSPVSGIITGKNIEVGDMAVPGVPLITVEDHSSFELVVNVDERFLDELGIGMPVEVFIDATGKRVRGRISEIVPAVDPKTRTFVVKVYIRREEHLRSGLYGRVLIPEGKKEAILVPEEALVERGQLVGVYTVDDKGILSYRLVRTGKKYNGMVEILSGLSGGEKVVVDGLDKVVDGGVVRQ